MGIRDAAEGSASRLRQGLDQERVSQCRRDRRRLNARNLKPSGVVRPGRILGTVFVWDSVLMELAVPLDGAVVGPVLVMMMMVVVRVAAVGVEVK